MPAFADALRAINRLKADGVVEDYAVAGAMALVFWAEPVPSYDLAFSLSSRIPVLRS